jgi:lipopolysaccharide export system ATP-binding protein
MNLPVPALERLERVSSGDLSSLITLRALLRQEGEDGWVPLETLAETVRAEYGSLSGGPAPVTPPWEATPADQEAMAGYLQDHVVLRWAEEGLLETRVEEDDPEGAVIRAVRLAPMPGGEREVLAARLEERLGEMLDTAAHHGVADAALSPVSPELVAEGSSTLSATGLVKAYRGRRVVNQVDVQVSQGEIVGLLGPNGAGKTTTFYMMVGLIDPDGGRVHIGGEEVTRVPMYRRARKGIGYLSQEPSVFRKLTVEENVLAILQMLGLPRREQRERLELLLDELGIKHLRKSKAFSLSGGERRRLEITRALVGRPKFMLLDEPFAGVDPIAVHDIQQIVADLRRRNIGVLISDHNVEQTLDIVDRAYIMYDGGVRVSGTVSELVWNDEVAEIYLGPTLTARMRQRYSFPG